MGGDLTSGGETNSGTPPIREDRNHKPIIGRFTYVQRSFRNSGTMSERFAAACGFFTAKPDQRVISRRCQSTRADIFEDRSEGYLYPLTSIRCANPNPPDDRRVFEFKLYEVFREFRSWSVEKKAPPPLGAGSRSGTRIAAPAKAEVSILDPDSRGNLPLRPILLPVIRRRPEGTLP